MIHISKRISIVLALCLAGTFWAIQNSEGPGLAPLPTGETGSDLDTRTTTSIDIPVATESPTDLPGVPNTTEGIDSPAKPRVLFDPGTKQEDGSPSKGVPKIRLTSLALMLNDLSMSAACRISEVGTANSQSKHGIAPVCLSVDDLLKVLKISFNETESFISYISTALSGGNHVLYLELKGSNYYLSKDRYPTDLALPYFVVPVTKTMNRDDGTEDSKTTVLLLGKDGYRCISHYNLLDYSLQGINYARQLATGLALFRFLDSRDGLGIIDKIMGSSDTRIVPIKDFLMIRSKGNLYAVYNDSVTTLVPKSPNYETGLAVFNEATDKTFIVYNDQVFFSTGVGQELVLNHLPYQRVTVLDQASLAELGKSSITQFEALGHVLSGGNTVFAQPEQRYMVLPKELQIDNIRFLNPFQTVGNNQETNYPVVYTKIGLEILTLLNEISPKYSGKRTGVSPRSTSSNEEAGSGFGQ